MISHLFDEIPLVSFMLFDLIMIAILWGGIETSKNKQERITIGVTMAIILFTMHVASVEMNSRLQKRQESAATSQR